MLIKNRVYLCIRMKKTGHLLLILFFYHFNALGQSFGCYDVSVNTQDNIGDDFIYTGSVYSKNIEWQNFNLKRPITNCFYEEYYTYKKIKPDTSFACKMKGNVVDGLQS